MSKIQSITINSSCSQSWQQMEKRENGRYCASCEKIVIDFSKMSNDEILAYLATATHVCGRISQTQLAGINAHLQVNRSKSTFSWKRWAVAAAFFGAGITSGVSAQAKPAIAATGQMPNDSLSKIVPVTDTMNNKPITYHISGRVIAADDSMPVPGALIRIKGTNINVQTDVNGGFELNCQNPRVVLVISYIGYETQEIQPRMKKNKKVKIILRTNSMMLGGMGIIRNAPKSRLEMALQRVLLPMSKLFS